MLLVLSAVALFFVLWGVLLIAEPLLRGSLGHFGNWTAHFRYRDYLPVIVILVVGGTVTLFAGDQFIDLAEEVHGHSPVLQSIDSKMHDWAVSERSPVATSFFVAMSIVGGPVVLGLVSGFLVAALAVSGRYRWAAYLAITAGGGALLLMELKRYFERARPDVAEMLRHAHGYSFPSGHAMGSTVVIGAITYLAMRSLTTWRAQSAALAGAVTFVLSVAASRVYLGVHWGSDIVAGISAGLLWVLTTTVAYETFRRIRLIRAIRQKRAAASS